MKITQTNGNSSNKIQGCRITIATDCGEIIDRFCVPSMFGGVNYCKKHPSGEYGQRFYRAIQDCEKSEWKMAQEKPAQFSPPPNT